MKRFIENHALSALYRVLENNQNIEFIYQGGKVAGRPFFSLRIRGKAQGLSSAEANHSLSRLKENLEATLAARSNLCFDDADRQSANAAFSAFNWCGELIPQGVLVSSGQTLQKASSKSASKTVSLSPIIPNTVSSISIVDALLASPRPVKVVVSVSRCSLTESDMQSLKKVIMSVNLGKAAYLMLPERRNLRAEEREIFLDPLTQHLTTWLTFSWGIRLSCTVHANEAPSSVFMTMLGSALYPVRKVTFSEKIAGSTLSNDLDQALNLDLRDCINASCVAPKLFPNPADISEIEGIKRYYAEPKEIPSESGLCLGVAGGREVCLSKPDRSRHTYLIGATGCGKSTLLYNMIMQDISAGEGVCVMDPHGDLYHDLLGSIPKSRRDKVVLIDPCDFDYPVGINFLEVKGTNRQVEMGFIANEMIKIFHRLYDMRVAGGPMFEQYMRNTLLLVMDNEFSGTLMDVVRALEDREYRKYLKSICKNPFVVNFWNKQAELVVGDADLKNMAPYITSKLNQFTHNPLMQRIIGQPSSTINFRQLMDDQCIVLVNLSKGLLGEIDSQLLGMILIGKFFLAAMGRTDTNQGQRTAFNWYIDEFQNFATDSIANLLSEARKYGVRLTLANQNMAQLNQNYGLNGIREAVLGNVANLLMFRIGVDDARQMQAYAQPELSSQDLQYLPDFHAVARLLKDNAPLKPFVLKTLPKQENLINGMTGTEAKAEIQTLSRAKFAKPVSEVESEIYARAHLPGFIVNEKPLVKNDLNETGSEASKKNTIAEQQSAHLEESMPGISVISDKSKKALQEFPVDRLKLTANVKKGLAIMNIKTVWELCGSSEQRLLANPYLGRKGTDEVVALLTKNGLTLTLRN